MYDISLLIENVVSRNLHNMISEGYDNLNVIHCVSYRPDGREICHLLKQGNKEAIKYAARIMAQKVPENAVLVPMPSRSGRATTMLELAVEISKITGNPVEDILRSDERESIFDMKRNGVDVTGINLNMRCVKRPTGTPCVIDNVYDTGETMRNALQVLGGGVGLVFARV